MNQEKKIFVTQPSLPPLSEFCGHLEKIWENKWITNNGPYHHEFEKELCKYLGVDYCSLCANGTLALMVALKALGIKGEVITTPFSFVATTHAIHWNGCKPVFCDIDEKTLNIDPEKIESLINPKTKAILPVHVYGNPCEVEKIQEIAGKYDLNVVYDAAHAFGTKINGKSVLNYGDSSILSFHATKVFNTIEGGAIISHSEHIKKKIDSLNNFGLSAEEDITHIGINGKMNELQSLFGILELKIITGEINRRRKIVEYYSRKLNKIPGLRLLKKKTNAETSNPYFPIFIDQEKFGISRDELYETLTSNGIYARKYFYPLISQFFAYKHLASASPQNLQVAEKVSKQVLCLPLHGGLTIEDADNIIDIICQ